MSKSKIFTTQVQLKWQAKEDFIYVPNKNGIVLPNENMFWSKTKIC